MRADPATFPLLIRTPPILGSTLRDETLVVEAGSPRPGEHASICLWNFGGRDSEVSRIRVPLRPPGCTHIWGRLSLETRRQ